MFVNLEKIEPKKCPSCPSESMGYAALSPGKGQHTPLFFLSFSPDPDDIANTRALEYMVKAGNTFQARVATVQEYNHKLRNHRVEDLTDIFKALQIGKKVP